MLTRRPFDRPSCWDEKGIWWRGGNTPPHVARLEWGKGGGVVEQHVEVASGACCCGGRGMKGGEGTAGGSSQKTGGALSVWLRTLLPPEHKEVVALYQPDHGQLEIAPAIVSVNTEAVLV
jgi:hypothetical protein